MLSKIVLKCAKNYHFFNNIIYFTFLSFFFLYVFYITRETWYNIRTVVIILLDRKQVMIDDLFSPFEIPEWLCIFKIVLFIHIDSFIFATYYHDKLDAIVVQSYYIVMSWLITYSCDLFFVENNHIFKYFSFRLIRKKIKSMFSHSLPCLRL